MAGISNTQIFNEIKDISVSLARVEGRLAPIESASSQLMKVVIQGNGKLPLTERMQKVEDCLAAQKDKDKEKKETKAKWDLRAWSIVMLFIGQIVILIFK